MSERPKYQLNALYILNFLFLHDVAAMTTFSKDKNEFFTDVLDTINDINSRREYKGIKAEAYKHFLLCGIEVLMYDTQESAEIRPEIGKVFDELIDDLESIGFLKNSFINDLDVLNKNYQFDSLPKELLYKLVSQIIYMDYNCLAYDFLLKMSKFNIFNLGMSTNLAIKNEEGENGLIRALLFFEFEILKDKFNLTKYRLLDKKYSFDKNILKFNNEKMLKAYFKKFSFKVDFNKLLLKDGKDFKGYIGSWFLFEKWSQKGDLTLHRTEDVENDKLEKSASEFASKHLDEDGIRLKPRAIYNRFLEFEGFYNLIRILFEERSKMGCRLDVPDFDDSLFEVGEISNSFNEALKICYGRLG